MSGNRWFPVRIVREMHDRETAGFDNGNQAGAVAVPQSRVEGNPASREGQGIFLDQGEVLHPPSSLYRSLLLMNRFGHSLVWILCLGISSAMTTGRAETGQKEHTFEIRRSLDYLLYLPERHESAESLPMIVFLHGAGERGDDVEKVKRHGPPMRVEKDPDFDFIVLSPQCPAGQRWSADDVVALVEHVTDNHKVDRDRIYLTGLSMGGFGTWDIAMRHSRHFAAFAPICGGGNPSRARFLRNLPIWVFHGAKDNVVPLSMSREMVDAIKEAGGNPKFTIYPEAGHDSWTEAYAGRELYDWFLQHRRSGRPQGRR